jgi:hypothetical protein
MKIVFTTFCFALFLSGILGAQEETSRFAFDIGGGFTQTVGTTGRNLDNGWNIGGGVGYNFSPYLGAMVQTNYNSLGINNTTLSSLGVPGGAVHVFSATIDPVVHLHPRGHWDAYIVGGGGLYHEYQELTAPAPGAFFGSAPFLGYYPGQIVLSSYSLNKPGANIGAGVSFGTGWHAKLYAEARWNHIFGSFGEHMDYVPVTFGVRW